MAQANYPVSFTQTVIYTVLQSDLGSIFFESLQFVYWRLKSPGMLTPLRLVNIYHNILEDLHLQQCYKDLSCDKYWLLSVTCLNIRPIECTGVFRRVLTLNSVIGIATAYGLDGPGIESRWGRDFPHLSRPGWGPPTLVYNGYQVFPGGKVRPAHDADPSPPSSTEVENRVELYLYSP
jgi:hypothetical protein